MTVKDLNMSPSEDLISSKLYILLKTNVSQFSRVYQRNNINLRYLLGGGQGTKHAFLLITKFHT